MKVKVTVWTLASDDDNGTQAAVFLTEREAEIAMIEAVWEGDANKSNREYAIRLLNSRTEVDLDELAEWKEDAIAGTLNTYSIDSHELEIEIPEVVTTEKVRKALVELLEEVKNPP